MFKVKREGVNSKNIVIQLDFSENYAVTHQNEIQSAHWSHGQVTLFTTCTWIEKDVIDSLVFISDDLDHDKFAVASFIEKHIKNIRKISTC